MNRRTICKLRWPRVLLDFCSFWRRIKMSSLSICIQSANINLYRVFLTKYIVILFVIFGNIHDYTWKMECINKFESSQRTLFLLFLVPRDKCRSQRAGDFTKKPMTIGLHIGEKCISISCIYLGTLEKRSHLSDAWTVGDVAVNIREFGIERLSSYFLSHK